ncbi:TerD family protein [Clostridium estertheticum]|uniref:TerD family protein n=1 Tax=Clostridium estertheticum TaxID=238834 RepID=UPI001C7E0080|nr:TerD family protein [Clostridium estertheticum]MBX4261832.1 TerD family protein [Clostridium estertheticum]WLC71256.1 TerD family protein [Clostridium estertheticum]
MAINIDNSNKKITSQNKRYGKLMVETSIRPENNSEIVVGLVQNVNKSYTQNTKNIQGVNNRQIISNVQPISNGEVKINALSKVNINMEKRKLVDVTKSIKLKKGQKLSLNENTKNLSKLIVTLDYNIMVKGNSEFDLDVCIFMVDINNKTAEKDFIFYGNTQSICGGVIIKKDHNTDLKEAYNESIQLDLNLIPMHIQKLAFTVTVYEASERNQNFGRVSDGYFRIISGDTKQEILSYKFNEDLSIETAVVVSEIYRYKNDWKINCIGSGFRGGLEELCSNYGIETI